MEGTAKLSTNTLSDFDSFCQGITQLQMVHSSAHRKCLAYIWESEFCLPYPGELRPGFINSDQLSFRVPIPSGYHMQNVEHFKTQLSGYPQIKVTKMACDGRIPMATNYRYCCGVLWPLNHSFLNILNACLDVQDI